MMSFLPEGFMINTKENITRLSSFEEFNRAFIENAPIEARAEVCDCNHNLHIDFGFIEGIIPREECATGISDGTTRDIAIISRVNKPVRFLIDDIRVENGKKVAYLSRRKLQQLYLDNYLSCRIPGDILDATVTHLEPFGAFCDIGCGINALLPIDSISVSRIPHPNVRFCNGDNIKAVIKGFDPLGRALLSHKELLGTWEENAALFKAGETVSGIVRSVESYGVFIELTPNLSGLAEYSSNVKEGDFASVYIKSIIPEKLKFKLVIIDSFAAEYKKEKPRYFISEGHIDNFRYSPKNATKIIETAF